jgi:hypothetical protein
MSDMPDMTRTRDALRAHDAAYDAFIHAAVRASTGGFAMVTIWTYCRNCVAWRPLIDERAIAVVADSSLRVCRRKCDVDTLRGPDDGCCEGVPKVEKAGGGK